ncbi:MAG TPA: hypothetical protein VGE35_01130 [Candidatus Paceibacterota bacterium]
MDPRFQTSFIPKKPIVAQPGRAPSSVNLFSLLATIVFIVALALSGGVYFYKELTQKQIDANKVSLEKAKGAFEPETINQIVRLDTRLENGKKILGNHIAVTPFFDFLSSITLKTVRFKTFEFNYLAKDKIQVFMTGQARDYASVALQSDLFDAQKYLKNTLVSDMSLDSAGTISFKVDTIVDPSLLSYAASIGAAPKAATTSRP